MLLTILSFIIYFFACFIEASWQDTALYTCMVLGTCSFIWRRKEIFGDINED
ncbi:MAG: hypothetical protein ACRC0F_01530 [Cetobacterium sp.]